MNRARRERKKIRRLNFRAMTTTAIPDSHWTADDVLENIKKLTFGMPPAPKKIKYQVSLDVWHELQYQFREMNTLEVNKDLGQLLPNRFCGIKIERDFSLPPRTCKEVVDE